MKLFARGTLGNFFKRDAEGKLVLDACGHPIVDFSQTTDEQLRTLKEFSYDAQGRPKIRIHDPKAYLDLLARHRGLLRDKVALTDGSGGGPTPVYIISDKPMTEEEWKKQFVREG